MRVGMRWSVKLAVCALALTLALAGKVLSEDKPAPAPGAPATTAPAPPARPDPSGAATGGITHGYPEVQGPNTVVRHLPASESAFACVAPGRVMAPEIR